MTNEFLGVGWNFPVMVDANNQIQLAYYQDSVAQSIWLILSTAPGERLMRPDFGCGIHNLVFGLNNSGTMGQITAAVRQALVQWEPRIDVLNVTTQTDTAQPSQVLIQIEYRVRTTNSRFNLVYPFFLE